MLPQLMHAPDLITNEAWGMPPSAVHWAVALQQRQRQQLHCVVLLLPHTLPESGP